MAYVTLHRLKQHLNIEDDVFEEDDYLNHLLDVAEATVEQHICQPLEGLEDGNGYIPKPLEQAVLLYCGTLYASRENVAFGGSPQNVPFTYDYLLSMFKNYKAQ